MKPKRTHVTKRSPFYGINNEQDILNTQLAVINDIVQELRRGTLYSDLYQLDGSPICTPFTERFENLQDYNFPMSGWRGNRTGGWNIRV
jgi:hypothetical protein